MESASEQSTPSAEQDETTGTEERDETTAKEQDASSAKEEENKGSPGDGSASGDHEAGESSGDHEAGEGSGEQEAAQGSSEEAADGDSGEEEDEGAASGRSIAKAIEDVSDLPGETVNDQDGRKIGQVKEIYGMGEDETPMWVTIESATGLGRKRQVFVPLARIKRQGDEIRVPYSFDHIHESPEIEPEDEVSEEDDRALRTYYAIGLADQELVESARSYASQVPEGEGSARKMDADSADGPARELDDTPPAKRVAEAYEKQKEEEGEEHRKGRDATADQIFEEDEPGDDGDQSDDDQSDEEKPKDGDAEKPQGEADEEPKGEAEEKRPDAQEKDQDKDEKDGES